MFYEGLYTELGRLFYHIAGVDGKVQPAERRSLQKLIDTTWKPLEDSMDEYGTDRSALIEFSFDYEESENLTENGFQSFVDFYKDNKAKFTPAIIHNIVETCKAIASAYRGKSKAEMKILEELEQVFQNGSKKI